MDLNSGGSVTISSLLTEWSLPSTQIKALVFGKRVFKRLTL